jgi:hypothetical protein
MKGSKGDLMKMTAWCAGVVLVAAAVPCFGAGQSWDGTWKLNEAKSKFTGETLVIEDKGNGMMHYMSGNIAFDFACDGKPYTVIADRTFACTGSVAGGYDYVFKGGDTVLTKSHRMFSADGKTMTVHGMDIRPDGSTQDFTDVWKRESGTSGLAGKWMNVKSQGASDTVVIETKGDWIKMYSPQEKTTVEGKMDGSNLAVKGPNLPPGFSQSLKPEAPNKLHYLVKYNDEVLSEGTQTLSTDGKTYVDENWSPGKMDEKSTAVYERQ